MIVNKGIDNRMRIKSHRLESGTIINIINKSIKNIDRIMILIIIIMMMKNHDLFSLTPSRIYNHGNSLEYGNV